MNYYIVSEEELAEIEDGDTDLSRVRETLAACRARPVQHARISQLEVVAEAAIAFAQSDGDYDRWTEDERVTFQRLRDALTALQE